MRHVNCMVTCYAEDTQGMLSHLPCPPLKHTCIIIHQVGKVDMVLGHAPQKLLHVPQVDEHNVIISLKITTECVLREGARG